MELNGVLRADEMRIGISAAARARIVVDPGKGKGKGDDRRGFFNPAYAG